MKPPFSYGFPMVCLPEGTTPMSSSAVDQALNSCKIQGSAESAEPRSKTRKAKDRSIQGRGRKAMATKQMKQWKQ